ncbi:uncharacterized protein BXZ73DRAFT_101592 [Epithele typhae]|uniref:uncharacterized protein n=1 Tax=Epithele typhae TaxID=378194 RepID=UPI002008C263|nr:uncharacterized protein BXZ73DRAFT_101592 [Epithele typhae]KAH9931680.1 hypothetical protein BXZ73DRAFT_101592 [Epithele typhae]
MATSARYPLPAYYNASLAQAKELSFDPPDHSLEHLGTRADKLMGRTLGPMPFDDFLNKFLTPSEKRVCGRGSGNIAIHAYTPSPSRLDPTKCLVAPADFETAAKAANADEKCDALLEALPKTTCIFRDAGSYRDVVRRVGPYKPDILCYTKANFEHKEALRLPPSSRLELGLLEMFIQVNAHSSYDIFVDPPAGVDPKATNWMFTATGGDNKLQLLRRLAHGRHIALVEEILARQHRTCLYTAVVSGSQARLYRWDRSGCVVTESFDICQTPNFANFLLHFHCLSAMERGFDTTLERPAGAEEALFLQVVTAHVKAQLQLEDEDLRKAISEHYEPGNAVVLPVLGHQLPVDERNVRRYVVSRPVTHPISLCGKGTRGYWAVDIGTHDIVFIKDTWPYIRDTFDVEGELLRRINRAGVRSAPSLIWHGIVPYTLDLEGGILADDEAIVQSTQAEQLAFSDWVSTMTTGEWIAMPMQPHYRIVVGTVGYSLACLTGSGELLHAGYDVMQALREAHANAGILHRDVSIGNIILVREPGRKFRRGYLIDWEASYPTDSKGGSLDLGLTCTYEFASSKMLLDPVERAGTLQDDVASLFYVILYYAFLFLPHHAPQAIERHSFYNLFQLATDPDLDGDSPAPWGKIRNEQTGHYIKGFTWPTLFREWLDYASSQPNATDAHASENERGWPYVNDLNVFWWSFLRQHGDALPTNDACEPGHASGADGDEPHCLSPPAMAPKRAREPDPHADDEDEDERPSKRIRLGAGRSSAPCDPSRLLPLVAAMRRIIQILL